MNDDADKDVGPSSAGHSPEAPDAGMPSASASSRRAGRQAGKRIKPDLSANLANVEAGTPKLLDSR